MAEPIPVGTLIESGIDDSSSDYHDGLDGYVSRTYDADTGVLTIGFERSETDEDDPFPPFEPDHGNAVYRFQLIND